MLSRRHGTKRVRASLVYNEFIAHKTHTHMNSTQWETLTSFVLYLGKVTFGNWFGSVCGAGLGFCDSWVRYMFAETEAAGLRGLSSRCFPCLGKQTFSAFSKFRVYPAQDVKNRQKNGLAFELAEVSFEM